MNLVMPSGEWKWDVLPLAAATVVAIFQSAWRSYQNSSSEAWQISYGRVLTVTTKAEDKRSVLTAPYSYRVGDHSYSGTFKKNFDDGDDAEDWEKVLPGRQIAVRFDPNKPSRSRVLESDIQPMVQAFAPSVPVGIEESEALPWWERLLCQLGFVAASSGFTVCVAEMVSADLGKLLIAKDAFRVLVMGAYPLALFSFWEGRRGGKRMWRAVPRWIKYLGYVVLYYTIFNALPLFLHWAGDQRTRQINRDANYQLALYFGAAEVLYARLRSESPPEDYLQRSLGSRVKIG